MSEPYKIIHPKNEEETENVVGGVSNGVVIKRKPKEVKLTAYEGMIRTNKKECPKCKSPDVVETGSKVGFVQTLSPNKKIKEPIIPTYKCKKCGEWFILN